MLVSVWNHHRDKGLTGLGSKGVLGFWAEVGVLSTQTPSWTFLLVDIGHAPRQGLCGHVWAPALLVDCLGSLPLPQQLFFLSVQNSLRLPGIISAEPVAGAGAPPGKCVMPFQALSEGCWRPCLGTWLCWVGGPQGPASALCSLAPQPAHTGLQWESYRAHPWPQERYWWPLQEGEGGWPL